MGINFYINKSFANLEMKIKKHNLIWYKELYEFIDENKKFIDSELKNLFSINFYGESEYSDENFIKGLIEECKIILKRGVLNNFNENNIAYIEKDDILEFFTFFIEICDEVIKNQKNKFKLIVKESHIYANVSIDKAIKEAYIGGIVWEEELQNYVYENREFISSDLNNLYCINPYGNGEYEKNFIKNLIIESEEVIKSGILNKIDDLKFDCINKNESITFFYALIEMCKNAIENNLKIITIGD